MKTKRKYRPNVGMMVLNAAGDVLAAKRVRTEGKAWQMPQGGIDKGEDPYDAALRELREETGISSVELVAESLQWYSYDFPQGVSFGGSKRNKFTGQIQKWFLFEFTGDESEIDINQDHAEFCEWKWEKAEKLPGLIIEFKKDVYSQVVSEFMPFVEAFRAAAAEKSALRAD